MLALATLALISRIAMAAILALAAAHSLRDWAAYRATVEQYRLVPPRWAALAGWLLPPAELLAAAALLAPPAHVAGAALGLALMLVFTAAVAINVARGRTAIDCGCGGAAGQRLSWGLVARNALLCGLLAVAFATPIGGIDSMTVFTTAAAAAAFLVITYFAGNQMLANAQISRA